MLVAVVASAAMTTLPARSASPEPPIVAGDPRSEGEGPGIMGSPVVIALGVVALGVVTAAVTLLVLRLTRQE